MYKHDSVCVASYFVGQVLALCPGWWQSLHSLARLAGGTSVEGLMGGGVGEGEETGDGGRMASCVLAHSVVGR